MQSKIQYRALAVSPSTADPDRRAVEVIAATDAPIPQYDWESGRIVHEVLRIDGAEYPERVPLLDSHDRTSIDAVIGSVSGLRSVDGRLVGVAEFSATAAGAWMKVMEGHLRDFSVGYLVHEVERVAPGKSAVIMGREYAGPVNVVTKWELKELSACPIGADPAAKARGDNMIGAETPERTDNMEDKKDEPRVDVGAERAAAREAGVNAERERVREIGAIAEMWRGRVPGVDVDGLARAAVESAATVAAFGAEVQKAVAGALPVGKKAEIGMTRKEARAYSIVKALRAATEGNWTGAELEREASEAVAKIQGRAPRGFFVAPDALHVRLDTMSMAGGGALVADNLQAQSFIELLRNKMRVREMGATVLSGLVGDISIPKQTGASTVTWIGEGEDGLTTAPTFGLVMMRPRTASAFVPMTRRLLAQSSMDIEMMTRNDLSTQLALAIDRAALHGSGIGNEPRGIEYTSGVNSVTNGSNGADPTFSKIIEMEGAISADNADIGQMGYLTGALLAAHMKAIDKGTGTGSYLWDGPIQGTGTVNGYRALASNQVRADYAKGSGTNLGARFFGVWSQLMIGEWGLLDVLVNPYALAASGGVQVHVYQDVDIAVRHPESFCLCTDFETA